MTGQELIDWIEEHHAENLNVVVQYRDDGGTYYGFDKELDPDFGYSGRERVVVL